MNFKNVFIFASGVAIGAFVTQQLLKQKYEDILQEEIESVKEVFGRNSKKEVIEENENNETNEPTHGSSSLFSKDEKKDYANRVAYYGYSKNQNDSDDIDDGDDIDDEPAGYEMEADSTNSNSTCYIIPPEEFGALYDYDAITLQYYSGDDMLTDDFDVPCENRDTLVPAGFERHYGEYEDDTVYVRNAILKADYEIIRVDEKFSDLNKDVPPHYQ